MVAVPSLCETFEALAVRTWLYLEAAQQTEIRIGEETLTDINLIEIQDQHPDHVVTAKFPKHMEAANGADWEWWFLARGRALGLRLQAKKLYPDGGYMSLYGRHRKQATTLLREAARDGITPLYCFYNHRNPPDRAEWPQLAPHLAVEQMGCGLASAHAVEAEVVGAHAPPTVDRLGVHQIPWRDLVCGLGNGENARPAGNADNGPVGDGENGPAGDGDNRPDGDGENGPDADRENEPPDLRELRLLRLRLVELAAERPDGEPQIVPQDELPDYVALVRSREPLAYRRKVPARRVTVLDFNRAATPR